MQVRTFLFLAALSPSLAQLFVSPAGSDANPGTSAAPFLTISRAQAAARSLPPPTTDLFIYIRAGSYFQSTPLTLTPSDSGSSSSARIRYTGGWPGDAPGAPPPIIHSGALLTGWMGVQVWLLGLSAGIQVMYLLLGLLILTLAAATWPDLPPRRGGGRWASHA